MSIAPPATAPTISRSSVLRGGLWSAASQVVPALGTAVLSVAAGRVLGSGPLGQQSLIAYVNSALASILVMSLNTALLQAGGMLQGRRDPARLKALMSWAVGAHLAAGAVVLVVMAVAGEITDENRLAWAVVGAVSVLDAATDGLTIRLILIEGWSPIGRLRLIFQMIGPFLGIGFLLAGFGIVGIFLGDGVAALGLLLAALPRFRRLRGVLPAMPDDAPERRRPRPGPLLIDSSPTVTDLDLPGPDPRTLGSRPARPRPLPGPAPSTSGAGVHRSRLRSPTPVLRIFALFALGGLITQVVSKRVEFVVLAAFSGDVAVGMYSVAFQVVSLLSMIPVGIATAAMPLIAAAEGSGNIGPATRHLTMSLRVGSAVTIPLVGLLAALGPATITLVYGPSYRTAALLVPFASSALLVSVIGGVCTQFWAGRGRLRIVLVAGVTAGLIDLGVALALVPAFGPTGATAANVAGQLALAAGLLRSTVRELGPIGWRWQSLLRAVVTGGAAAAASLAVGLVIDIVAPFGIEMRSLLIVIFGGVAGAAAAIGTATVVKIFDPDESEWVIAMLPGRVGGLLTRMSRSAAPSIPGPQA